VSTKDALNALKGQHGFALHMVEVVDVPFLDVTKVLVTSSIVPPMVAESAVNSMVVTSRLLVALAFALLTEAVADVS
jgi:hypothetical protein